MDGIREFWATGIGKVIITGVLSSTLLVCVLLGLVLIRNNLPESQSDPEQDLSSLQTQVAETTPTSQPAYTATPTLTETPSPTDTPVSDATRSSSGPSSTGGSSSNGSGGTDPYANEVNVRLRNYQNALSNVDGYFQESSADPSVLLNNNWKQKANMALNQLDQAAEQLESLEDAPPECEQLDAYLESLASETHMLVENYETGIDQLDPNAINKAASNLNKITSSLDSTAQELDKCINP